MCKVQALAFNVGTEKFIPQEQGAFSHLVGGNLSSGTIHEEFHSHE